MSVRYMAGNGSEVIVEHRYNVHNGEHTGTVKTIVDGVTYIVSVGTLLDAIKDGLLVEIKIVSGNTGRIRRRKHD